MIDKGEKALGNTKDPLEWEEISTEHLVSDECDKRRGFSAGHAYHGLAACKEDTAMSYDKSFLKDDGMIYKMLKEICYVLCT